MPAKILLVDDDEGLVKLLAMRLKAAGFKIDTAFDAKRCLEKVAIFEPDIIISDLKMDGMDGLELFYEIRAKKPLIPFIMITAHGTIPDAVEATQEGVYSFIPKPIDTDELLKVIQTALHRSGAAQAKLKTSNPSHGQIITNNPAMLELLKQVNLVARSETNILITGESGSGKELLAKAVHSASHRASGPFVAVNCAAIPSELLESELFGHMKGAFTGADKEQKGLLYAASEGTLFLDEIGDMPLFLQSKLLRFLEERTYRPVGSNVSVKADVRIISATHQDLTNMIEQKLFREDLFYRLNVVDFKIPALDKRRDDIALLAKVFLERAIEKHNLRSISLAPKAIDKLTQANWPGNIRQLNNIIERLAVLNQSGVISEFSVIQVLSPEQGRSQSLAEARSEFERDYLIGILRQAKGNVSRAARAAQRNRTDFYKLMARHNIQPGSFKEAEA